MQGGWRCLRNSSGIAVVFTSAAADLSGVLSGLNAFKLEQNQMPWFPVLCSFSCGAPLSITASEKNINSTVVIYNSNVVNKDWDMK